MRSALGLTGRVGVGSVGSCGRFRALVSAEVPNPWELHVLTVRYGDAVDDEIQLRIEGGTLLISVPKAVKNLYLTARPFHELRVALAQLADHVRPR